MKNEFAASLLETGFGRQDGALEDPMGRPGEAKRSPRPSQERFWTRLFSKSILTFSFIDLGWFWDSIVDPLGRLFGTVFQV